MLIKFLDGTERKIIHLHNADLRNADLRNADLRSVNLWGTNLGGANLCGADLRNADLRNANLYEANLYGTHLWGTNLRNADLRNADLRGADLCRADLRSADLRGANLCGADLRGVKNIVEAYGLASQVIVPEGQLIGYKKLGGGVIAKLRIPAAAKRVNAYGSRKCRAEYAIVLSGEGVAMHDSKTRYTAGKKVTPDRYDPDPTVECSHGIHFFITEQEAKDYE